MLPFERFKGIKVGISGWTLKLQCQTLGLERHRRQKAEDRGLQIGLCEFGVGGSFHLPASRRRLSISTVVWKLRRRLPGPLTPPHALCPGSPTFLQQCTFCAGCDLYIITSFRNCSLPDRDACGQRLWFGFLSPAVLGGTCQADPGGCAHWVWGRGCSAQKPAHSFPGSDLF